MSAIAESAGADVPNVGDTFKEWVGRGCDAVIDISQPGAPRVSTYEALDGRCAAVARGLARASLEPGERVAILSLNRVEFIEVMFGAMRAGCVPVPVNIKLSAEAIAYIIENSGARLAFVDAPSLTKCPPGLAIVGFDDAGAGGFQSFLDPGPFRTLAPPPRSVAIQPYSSGSTGTPKGILLCHEGIDWVTRTAVSVRKMDPSICSIVAAPLFHKNAAQTTKQTLTAGGRIVVMAQFEVHAYIDGIGRFGVTLLNGVPTMFQMVLREKEHLARTDLGSVTRIGFGSAPGSEALFDALEAAFPNARIENNYGITEGGPIMFGPHPDGRPRPRNSVGYVLPGAEVRLDGGADADEGVLHVKSPGIMLGYHKLPELTAEKLKDGWLDTGDVLRRDADGFYYFVGRADDMFVCGGENIYPIEVESLLERHPAVAQAVVVPANHELKTHVPYAFVVAAPGAAVTEHELKAFALARGPAYAHPRRVFLVEDMPLAGTGKIDRKALTARANAIARKAEADA